jgi:hypothetical protein
MMMMVQMGLTVMTVLSWMRRTSLHRLVLLLLLQLVMGQRNRGWGRQW